MWVSCGLEWVLCFGFSRWAWKRFTYIGSYDSQSWPSSSAADFSQVPRISRVILAVYEDDLSQPRFPPQGGYRMDPTSVIKRVTYGGTSPSPPYIIYADHPHKEIILAIRGLNIVRNSDYRVLLDNRLGMQMFDGGFVHHGLLKAATWVLNRETGTLRRLLAENGTEYRLVFAGHSLGSGVASLMTVIVVNHRGQFGGIARDRIRCYALAPARCMSLNLAVKYADVINSVVLQDDFLPRTPTPLEHIFGSIFCLPCFLFSVCLRDTFVPESRKLKDPRRLYAPGRMYHIVERRFCRCGRYPPEVRTAIPVEGRFEHIVLSCNATSDHAILWIEREAQKALERMSDATELTSPPVQQTMERKQTREKEHMDALQKAVSLNVPHAVMPQEGPVEITAPAESSREASNMPPEISKGGAASRRDPKFSSRTNWDDLVAKLFDRNESGHFVLKKNINGSQ